MQRRFSVEIILVIGLGSAVACGGSIVSGKDSSKDSVDDGSGSDDDGGVGFEGGDYVEGSVNLPDGGFAHDCPPTAPSTDSPCSVDYSRCEYGSDLFYDCNTIAVCEQGLWSVIQPSTTSICSQTYVNPPDCPAASDDVPVGGDCSTPQTCLYLGSNPRLCTCAPDNMGDSQVWGCYQPQAGCPAFPNRPRIGTLCSTEDLECDYGSCGNDTNVECAFGEWGLGGCDSDNGG